MLAFFVLSAFIPVLFLAILSYWESNRMLVKQAHTRLGAASDTYNKSIYDRLHMTNQLLSDVVQRSIVDNMSADTEELLGKQFRGLTLILPTGKPTPLFGKGIEVGALSVAAMKHLSQGKSLLLTQQSGLDTQILILRAQDPQASVNGILIAEIIPDYLWGDPKNFALDVSQCILNKDYVQLFLYSPASEYSIAASNKECGSVNKRHIFLATKSRKLHCQLPRDISSTRILCTTLACGYNPA